MGISFLLGCHKHNHMVDDIRFNLLRTWIVAGALYLAYHIHTLHDIPKQIILLLQFLCVIYGTDEKLAPIGIWARIGHCYRTRGVFSLYRLVVEFIARTTLTITLWVARLDNEVSNDAMEDQPIIEPLLGQEHKVVHGVGRKFWIECQDNQTLARINTDTIDFLGIDEHSGSVLVGVGNLAESYGTGRGRYISQLVDNILIYTR